MGDYPNIRDASALNDMLFQLSRELPGRDLVSMKHLCSGRIPGGSLDTCQSPMDLFNLMTQERVISSSDTRTLSQILRTVGRVDLGEAVEEWANRQGQPGNGGDSSGSGEGGSGGGTINVQGGPTTGTTYVANNMTFNNGPQK